MMTINQREQSVSNDNTKLGSRGRVETEKLSERKREQKQKKTSKASRNDGDDEDDQSERERAECQQDTELRSRGGIKTKEL